MRTVRIFNGQQRLRFDRRQIAALFHLLDARAADIVGARPPAIRCLPSGPGPATCDLRPATKSGAQRPALDPRLSTLGTWRFALGAPPPTLDSRPSAAPGVPPGELSVAFLPDEALAALHGRFLGDASRTDVITFAGDPAPGQAGEICVSADAARAFAERRGGDFSAELTLYLVHGWLHLAGHDDRAPARKRRMRAAEARAMALLRATGTVPRFRLT